MLITLTTDFGLHDHFVGTMKGVLLSINPTAQIVDISHAIQPFDVLDGALTIAQAYSYFPSETVHVVVVDPGVGTARRPLVVDAGRHRFVAPDNGVLSFVYEREERVTVRHITAEHYFLQPVCPTFHARDIFAPVAAHISKGVDLSKVGDEVTDYVRFALPQPKPAGSKALNGIVLKVDNFGNLITNIRPEDVQPLLEPHPPAFRILAGKGEVRTLRQVFAEGASGEVFAIFGSMGFLELATNRGSAAHALGANRGTDIRVMWE